jgi:hypothetical protein
MSGVPAIEHHATLRIDPTPGAKRFQGVWLEQADGTRWVVDYRARELWTWFADHEVIVTGEQYAPQGQAVNAVHYRVDTVRFATPEYGRGPYLSMGPEQVLAGTLVTERGMPGGKLAGSSWPAFVGEDGRRYVVLGEELAGRTGPVRVRARLLEPDMSYTARTGGLDLWIVAIEDELD